MGESNGSEFSATIQSPDYELHGKIYASSHRMMIEKIMYVAVDKLKNKIDVEHSLKVLYNINAPFNLYAKYGVGFLAALLLSNNTFGSLARLLYDRCRRPTHRPAANRPVESYVLGEKTLERFTSRYAKCLRNKVLVIESLQFFCVMNFRCEKYEKYNIAQLIEPFMLSDNFQIKLLHSRLYNLIQKKRSDMVTEYEAIYNYCRMLMAKAENISNWRDSALHSAAGKQYLQQAEDLIEAAQKSHRYGYNFNPPQTQEFSTIDEDRTYERYIEEKKQYVSNWIFYQFFQPRMISIFDLDDCDQMNYVNNTVPIVTEINVQLASRNNGSDSDSDLEDVTSLIMREYNQISPQTEVAQESVNNSNNLKRNNTDAIDPPESKQIRLENMISQDVELPNPV